MVYWDSHWHSNDSNRPTHRLHQSLTCKPQNPSSLLFLKIVFKNVYQTNLIFYNTQRHGWGRHNDVDPDFCRFFITGFVKKNLSYARGWSL